MNYKLAFFISGVCFIYHLTTEMSLAIKVKLKAALLTIIILAKADSEERTKDDPWS